MDGEKLHKLNVLGRLARKADKDYFIGQLKIQWAKVLLPGFDVEAETNLAWQRICDSPLKDAFDAVEIDRHDIYEVVKSISDAQNKTAENDE